MSRPEVIFEALFLQLNCFKPQSKNWIENWVNQVKFHKPIQLSFDLIIFEVVLRFMVLEHGKVGEEDKENAVESIKQDHLMIKFFPY